MLTSGKSFINHNVLQSQICFIAIYCHFYRVDMLIFFLRLSTMFTPFFAFVNKSSLSSKIQARKREYQRENISYRKAYDKRRAKNRKVSFCVLYVFKKIYERNAGVHAKPAKRRAESKPAHNIKFAYNNG